LAVPGKYDTGCATLAAASGKRQAAVGRDAAIGHQRDIAQAADAQEGGEIIDRATILDDFVVQLGDQLVAAHAVARRDFL